MPARQKTSVDCNVSDVAQPFFVGTTRDEIALDDICDRRNRVSTLRRLRMLLFDSHLLSFASFMMCETGFMLI
jgi:hypothetical protein